MFHVAVPCLKKKEILGDYVGLHSPLLPSLLVMCCAGGEGMPKADQDGGPVALQWCRLSGMKARVKNLSLPLEA